MKKVYLVPVNEIINNSVIEQNVDVKILGQTLSMVQDVYLRPILGASIYNSLIDAVYEHTVNGDILSSTYADLASQCKSYLIARTVSEFLILNSYKIGSKGVIKLQDNSGQTADENTIENLKNYYDNLSSRYKAMLVEYLAESGLFNASNDVKTSNDSAGWFLDDYDTCSTNTTVNSNTQAITDTFTNSGAYDSQTGILTFTRNDGLTYQVDLTALGATGEIYTSGGTLSNNILSFTRTDGGVYSINLNSLVLSDTVVTGGTYSNGTVVYRNNTGGTFSVTGFYTGYTPSTDVFITGGTYNSGTATFRNTTGGTFSVTGFTTGNFIQNQSTSAQTSSFWITGTGETNSYFAGRTSGANGNFKTGGLIAYPTGTTKSSYIQLGYDSLLNAGWITALSEGSAYRDIILGTGNVKVGINTTSAPAASLEILNSSNFPSIRYSKGGNYWTTGNRTEGSGTSFNIAYNTSDILSLTTGGNALVGTSVDAGFKLDVQGTGRYTNGIQVNTAQANSNTYIGSTGTPFSFVVNAATGCIGVNGNNPVARFQVNGGSYTPLYAISNTGLPGLQIASASVSASTYILLVPSGGNPKTIGVSANGDFHLSNSVTFLPSSDTHVFYQNGNMYAQGNTHLGTPNDNGYRLNVLGTTFLSHSATPLTLSGVQASTDALVLTIDASGVVHTIATSSLGSGSGSSGTEIYVTGGTYSNGTATFRNNTGGTFNVTGFSTGSTGTDTFVTGGTYSNGTTTFRNNTGGTFTVNGYYTGYTAPVDLYITGGTYSNGTATLRNNTGGTFNITGFYTGYTAPVDVYVTGGTYSSGSITFRNNTGGTFNVTGLSTGGTGSGLATKSGLVTNSTFTGDTKKAVVTFSSSFASTNYSVVVTGDDARIWTTESRGVAGFIINSNSTDSLLGTTSWVAILNGEA